jgi:hypothetical protein
MVNGEFGAVLGRTTRKKTGALAMQTSSKGVAEKKHVFGVF